MLDAKTKKAVRDRLRRIGGQVEAIERMVEADRYCIDLMHQLDAVQAAIGKVSEEVLHLTSARAWRTRSARATSASAHARRRSWSP
jgi:DNA-binding FrmR family transcriptional regulator